MSIISGMSSDAGSTRNTSRIIGPILRWFNPDIPDETIRGIQLVVRKTAHFIEYGILALLLWRARRRSVESIEHPWRWSKAGVALGATVLFAITDEWHQSFVPSREGSLRDVLIDSAGAAAALAGWWWLGRRLRKW
jgi:VanZ family protein